MGTTQDTRPPLVDFKVSWFLSDHLEPGTCGSHSLHPLLRPHRCLMAGCQACTLLVPGSHAWTSTQRANWENFVDPADVVSVRVPPGSIMIWRNCKQHLKLSIGFCERVSAECWGRARHAARGGSQRLRLGSQASLPRIRPALDAPQRIQQPQPRAPCPHPHHSFQQVN